MALFLFESNRDNLLLPYFELVKSKGINISFGQFKSILLEHLTKQGRLFNLSLSSNYYLAGAARYYFNGDLTENSDLALFYDYTINSARNDPENNAAQNHKDIFKSDVCIRLNALIKILRNAYIETIGTAFEQPEDFGNLPLKKLLSKYGAKIKKELLNGGEEIEQEEEKYNSVDVGNGYTFDIIYNQEEAKKYYEATNPRAWCITFSLGNYDYYIKTYKIHYVIFRKNGYENVERIPNKKAWKINGNNLPKPQDEYGNSLIALLQSNNSWEPKLITSRWNHGAGDTGAVEADHAYTIEEFMNITGVSEEDLKQIYKIWSKNVVKNNSSTDTKKEMKENLLKIKEIQMRINGGENPLNLLEKRLSVIEDANGNARKSVFIASLRGTSLCFIVDKGKIVFESICQSHNPNKNYNFSSNFPNPSIKNVILCDYENYEMLYDYRKHSLLSIDGKYKFKAVPRSLESSFNPMFYEVKLSHTDIALVDTSANNPLRLPNGQFWFNELHIKSNLSNTWTHGNKVAAFYIGDVSTSVVEIVYDSSSREKYFFNLKDKKFIEIPEFNGNDEKLLPKRGNNNQLEPILADVALGSDLYAIRYTNSPNSRWHGYSTPMQVYKLNGEKIFINGSEYFSDVKYLGNGYVSFVNFYEDENYDVSIYGNAIKHYLCNVITNKIYTLEGRNLVYTTARGCGNVYGNLDSCRCIYFLFPKNDFNNSYSRLDFCYLFDKKVGKFVKNPYNFPSKETFYNFGEGNADGSNLSFFKTEELNVDDWNSTLFKINLQEGVIYEFKYNIYGYEENKDEGRFNIRPIEYFED